MLHGEIVQIMVSLSSFHAQESKILAAMEACERFNVKTFANGDRYEGHFKGILPHGTGKYLWADNTVYEGDWELGRMTGNGKISWSSGGTYVGEFSGGYLQGFGTFNKSDGSVYIGSWRLSVQHGFGVKQYLNSETYEGSWKGGIPNGTGKYSWSDTSVYTGDWKAGKMSGRGFIRLANGDSYDGHWLNGFKHGSGIYKFSDGVHYFGMWSWGLKDGKGTFYPAGIEHPPFKNWYSSKGYNNEMQNIFLDNEDSSKSAFYGRLSETISRNPDRVLHKIMLLDQKQKVDSSLSKDASCALYGASVEDQCGDQEKGAIVYEREYMQGVLIKETITSFSEVCGRLQQHINISGKEDKRSYYLMLNLQLGIRYTVGKIAQVPPREVRSSDFGLRARIRMSFRSRGSQYTPSHNSISFHWKDYCPMVFRNLREMFKLDAADYMMSICGDDGLREVSSTGKSGSIFYLSQDDNFVIKTLKRYELKVLLGMLPEYYDHVRNHENTLITKFFGVHCITLRGWKKVRFVVMGNMFCTELQIHRRFDLKGSSLGRCTPEDKVTEKTTLKDLDLSYEFHLDKCLRDELFQQIRLDCKFLESQHIIDYSLLLGLHFRAPNKLKPNLESTSAAHHGDESSSGASSENERPYNLLLVTHEPSSVTRAPGPHVRGKALKAFSVGGKEVDLLLPETGRVQVQLGVNMPAQATQRVRREVTRNDSSKEPDELFEVYNVVLYLGIIDILQEYNLKKKMEHAYKAFKFDPLSISVAAPKIYAKRFTKFLNTKVFPEDESI